MTLILELSKYIVIPIFLEWCTVCDVVFLDSAVCNSKLRHIFMEWTKEFHHGFQQHFFPGYNNLPCSLTLFEWKARRNIKFDGQRIVVCDKQLSLFQDLSKAQRNRLKELSTCLDAVIIKNCSMENTNSLCELLCSFSSIVYVVISECAEINPVVQLMAVHFPKIEDCAMKQSRTLLDVGLIAFSRGCIRLMTLDLSECPLITDHSVFSILIYCTLLFHLNVKGCPRITARAICVWCLHNHRKRNCPIEFDGTTDLLTRLCVHYYMSSPYSWDLSSCVSHSIVDRSLVELARYNPDVFDLNLQYCADITDHSFVPSIELLHNLSRINIKGVHFLTDDSIRTLCLCCPRLRDISFGGQLKVTDGGWSALAECKNLVRLTMVRIYLGMALKTILSSCDKMKHLLLGDILGLTDSVWMASAPHVINLEKISLVNCKDFGDEGLVVMSKYTLSLLVFNIYDCFEVTDAGIIAVVKNSVDLRVVGFQDIKLTKWLVRACDRITVMTIWRQNTGKSYLNKGVIIMKRCVMLTTLQIQHVSDDEIAALNELSKELRPGLTVTNDLK